MRMLSLRRAIGVRTAVLCALLAATALLLLPGAHSVAAAPGPDKPIGPEQSVVRDLACCLSQGGPNEEENVITGFGSFFPQSPLQFDHEAGEDIQLVTIVPKRSPASPTPSAPATATPTATPTETPMDTPEETA